MDWSVLAAVVTGGASGIGKCVCNDFVQRGASVVIADVNREGGMALEKEINEKFKNKAFFVYCDVTDPQSIQNAIDTSIKTFGRFDVMCNNAGIGGSFGSFNNSEDVPFGIKNATAVVKINLEAVVLGTMLALRAMRKSGNGGVIINTASMGGIFPMPYNPVYAATKSGVIQFSRSLGNLQDENIRVSAICPTYTITPLTSIDELSKEQMKKEVGGNMLVPEDVSKGFMVLVDDMNSGGKIMRVTKNGLDYYTPRAVIEPTPKL